MGLYINVSPQMEDIAYNILKAAHPRSNLFRIQCKIIGGDDTSDGIVVIPKYFEEMVIVNDFENEYHEKISAVVNISMGEAMLLLSNSQDLIMDITFEHVEQYYHKPILNIPKETKRFRVLINNSARATLEQDVAGLLAAINNTSAENKYTWDDVRSARYRLLIELVDDTIYEFSKRPMNALAKDTTVEAVVHYVANALDIKKVYMITPDNNTQYKHVVIPPFTTIEAIDKLQDTKGIYTKGVGYYYFGDALYVYPEYDTDPKKHVSLGSEVHLYRFPVHSFPGGANYSAQDNDGNISIMLIDTAKVVSISEMGTEIGGNFVTSKRTDTILDVDTEQKGKEATVRDNNQLSISIDEYPGYTKSAVRMRFDEISNNPVAMASSIASTMCCIMATTWEMAWPWSIHPGQKLVYYYEENQAIQEATGIISGVEYSLEMVAGFISGDGDLGIYAWNAALVARLSKTDTRAPEFNIQNLTVDERDTIQHNQVAWTT